MYIPPFKEFAVGLVMRSGTILMRNFHDHSRIRRSKKSRYELVTQSDMEVHKFVEYKIRQQFPDHNFMSEEGDMIDNGSDYTWVLDPLDGTLNYTIGNPFFSTSLVLLEKDTPIIGVVYSPFNREMFVAEKERVCRLNERNVKVSSEKKLRDSVLSYSYFYRDKESRKQSMEVWEAFSEKSRSMRHLGCTTLELAYVACGRMEASIIAPPLRPWDVYAGLLMIEVAGGKITNFEGKEWESLEQGVIASNGLTHRQILNVLKK